MADVKISALPAGVSALSTDQHPVNQGGTTRRITNSQISDFIKSVPPSVSVGIGVAFGVQINNASSRIMLAIINVVLSYNHNTPGQTQASVVTDATNPTPMSICSFTTSSAIDDGSVTGTVTAIIAPGGWYMVVNDFDPNAANSISNVWHILL